MIQPISIDHMCLLVTSLARAKLYYEQVFDLICTPREDDPKTLAVESKHLHFFISEAQGIPKEFLKKQHISFMVDSLRNVELNLEKIGVYEYETGDVEFFQYRNYKWCEWRDPDGIRIECVENISVSE